ncbi:MAG: AbrB/MazE/SpoVT family DNA-binding domain-containing protein [Actinomycetales bacterium]
MRTSIDVAGRIVVPKGLREQVGLTAGIVNVHVEGNRIVIEPVVEDGFVERDGLMVVPASGEPLTDDVVRATLEAGRR